MNESESIDGLTGRPRQQYTVDFVTVPDLGIAIESNCADITFTNYGGANLIVNDVVILATNQSITISANRGEIDRTKYRVRYSGAGTKNAIVVRRIYK